MKLTSYKAVATALGAAIRAERKRLGLTQEDVAHDAGISVSHYAKVERGMSNSTLRSLVDIARVLRLDFPELVNRTTSARSRSR